MPATSNIDIYSDRGQCITLLLATLCPMKGRIAEDGVIPKHMR